MMFKYFVLSIVALPIFCYDANEIMMWIKAEKENILFNACRDSIIYNKGLPNDNAQSLFKEMPEQERNNRLQINQNIEHYLTKTYDEFQKLYTKNHPTNLHPTFDEICCKILNLIPAKHSRNLIIGSVLKNYVSINK